MRKNGIYRFWRGVIRLWFALTFHRIHVLHEERLKRPDPALLVVSHPASFLDALILVAGLERHVRCLIPAKLIQGLLQPLIARCLGMISFLPEDWQVTVEKCSALLAEKAALVTFVEPGPAHPPGESRLASAAAWIAVEAEARHGGGLGLMLFPVHLFLPVGHTHARELLIDIDQPESAQAYISRASGTSHDQVQELAKALERRCQENSFRLQPADLTGFLGDLEEALLAEFQEDGASHPPPKQKRDGFQLSRFVVEWAEEMNYLHPGLLVSLRESLEAWREARRLGSLHRLELEATGDWWKGPAGLSIIWLESVAGFPIALYGLLTHLLAISLLYLTGLLKEESGRSKSNEWLARGLVVLGCYAAEVFLVAHFGGRRAAGYFAPTLPLSALYLWRYTWLLRHRTRLAFVPLNLAAETAKAKRLRKGFLHEINAALDRRAEELGLPH
jgi:hypothetical protein